jgi:hypothetical protein
MSVPAATCRDYLEAWLGQPYDQSAGRDDPNHYGHDCSGYQCAAWTAAHGYVGLANLSWSIFDQCNNAGLIVPWNDAYLAIPYVFRFMPAYPGYPDGAGNNGHIGCTDGRGSMLEAWGGGGCSRTPANFEQWDGYAGFAPDTDYLGHGVQPAPQRKQVDQDMFLASSTTSNGQPEGIRRWVFDDDGATQINDSMGTNLGNTMAYAGDIDALEVVAWNIAHGRNPDGTHK